MYTIEYWSKISGKSEVKNALEELSRNDQRKYTVFMAMVYKISQSGMKAVNGVNIKILHLRGTSICIELKNKPYRLYGILGSSKFLLIHFEWKKSTTMKKETREKLNKLISNVIISLPYEF